MGSFTYHIYRKKHTILDLPFPVIIMFALKLWLRILRCQLLADSILIYWGAKSKYLNNIWSQGSILRFHIFWNLQYLLSVLLEGFDKWQFGLNKQVLANSAKQCFACKHELLHCYCRNTKLLRAFFSPNQLFYNLLWHHQQNYHLSRMQCPI